MEGLLRAVLLLSCAALALGQIDCSCDVALVLDVSGSIRTVDYPQVQTFAKTIVESLAPKMGKGVKGARVGVISFSNDATVVQTLTDNAATATAAITSMKKSRGTTRTDLAVDAAAKMLTTNRPQGKCVTTLVMTDGISNYPTDTQVSATKAKAAGITIVAIGVGPMVNSTELELMASPPAQKNAVKISEFRGLKQIAHSLYDKCSIPIKNQTGNINYCECDMMLILDASGSISALDWEHMLDFARTIIRGYSGRLGIDSVRIGIITFSHKAVLQAPLSYDPVALLEVVDGLQKTTGTTNSTDALLLADTELFKHRRAIQGTNDTAACQVIRMVTDGRSNDPQSTAQAAYLVKDTHDINTMAIGVGPLVDPQELKAIASQPHAVNVIQLQQFNRLDQVAHNISDSCVKEPEKEPVLEYNYCHCDLIFIFDASGSILQTQWDEVKKFATIVLDNVKDSLGPKGTRVSIIHYHNRANMVLNLTSNYNEIRGAIDTMQKTQGTTRTWLALDLAHQEFVNFTNGLGKCRYVMVLTDGASNKPELTIAAAHRLKANDLVLVQAVALGQSATDSALQSEIKAITSDNLTPITLQGSDSYQQLSKLAHDTFDRCNTTTPEPPVPEPTPDVRQEECGCDVMLIMDASGSIQAQDWVKAKDFARIMVTGLAPFMAMNQTRLGIVAFSSKASLVLPLTFDTHLAQGVINSLNKTTGTTRTDRALKLATRELWKNRKPGGCMTVQLITDGQSNDPAKTEVAAHALKQVAWIMSIGVGVLANSTELEIISTNKNYTMLQNWDGLAPIAHQLADPCLKKANEATPTPMVQQDDCNCDMMLVFDASGSIWTSHWTNVKAFASTIVRGVQDQLAAGTMRLGIVMFANSAKLVMPLSSNNVTLLNAIAAMNKTNGSTRTWKGLLLAQQELMRSNRGLSSCKTIKLITDGNSNNKQTTETTASKIKRESGIIIMAVGVGALVTDVSELKAVASNPIEKNYYMIDSFKGLESLAHVISDKCKPKEEFDDCKCDMVIVLDVSGSITLDDLELVKQFALVIVKGMQPRLASGEVRIGLVSFASKAVTNQPITRSYTDLVSAISNLQKTNGVTRTNKALQLAGNMLVAAQRSPTSCKSIKLVTDGRSTFPNKTAAAAQFIKSQYGVTIMAIGVSENVGLDELEAVSSPPQAKNLKLLEDYGGLNDVAHLIADKCSGIFEWKSSCKMGNLMTCLTSAAAGPPCSEIDMYNKCAMMNNNTCPDLMRIWCGMIFNGPQYNGCSQKASICGPALNNANYSKCDLGFYQECYTQMKQTSGMNKCSQLNRYVWCAEAAVCGDLVNYLCVKGEQGESGVTANGCKVTSCGHVKFMVDAKTRHLVRTHDLMSHANELQSSPINWVVIALGCVVGVLAVGLLVVAVKYRKALQEEEAELSEGLM